MVNNKITYKGMKLGQRKDLKKSREEKDLKKHIVQNSIHRNISTYFAYVFVKLNIKPNTITISSFFICILGFIFLSIGTYMSLAIGSLLFILFRIMDEVDGEVARATNQVTTAGKYFEIMQEYVCQLCLGIGLGIGMFKLYDNITYLYLGFFLMLFSTISCTTSFIKREYSNWQDQNIFLKLFNLYPAGLFFSNEFIAPILITLIVVEVLLNIVILPIYLYIFLFTKLLVIIFFVLKEIKNETNKN